MVCNSDDDTEMWPAIDTAISHTNTTKSHHNKQWQCNNNELQHGSEYCMQSSSQTLTPYTEAIMQQYNSTKY